MQYKVKLVMVGPMQSGKTTLANFLSESGEVGSSEYRPTKGCRIVEFEVRKCSLMHCRVPRLDDFTKVPDVKVGSSSQSAGAEVELWDVSGDKRYETTWPVLQRGSHGVIFVCNPGSEEQQRQQLESLYTQFVQQCGVKDSQCVVLCHHKPGTAGTTRPLGGPFSRIPQLDTQLDDDSVRVKPDFAGYLSHVLSHMAEASTHTENMILQ